MADPTTLPPPVDDGAVVLVLAEFIAMRNAGDPNADLLELMAKAIIGLRLEVARLRHKKQIPGRLRP